MKYRGYIVVIAAICMQTCLGGIYAWSAFVESLKNTAGFSNAQSQMVFGAYIFFNTAAMILVGRLQDRFGPRIFCILSGVLISASYLLSGYFGQTFWILFLSYGVLGGLANASGYICAIPACAKWFPKHSGLVCGLAVAGYGAGGIVLSAMVKILYSKGLDAFGVFRLLSVIYGSIVLLSGSLICDPPRFVRAGINTIPFKALLGDRRFWRLAVSISCITISGVIIIGNIKPLGIWFSRAQSVAILSISMFSIGSASGRVVWGYIYDVIGGRKSVILLLVCAICIPMAMLAGGRAGDFLFLALALIAGFVYGGCFPVISAQAAKLYGIEFFGAVYPLVLFAHGVAAQLSPTISGFIFDKTSSFTGGLVFASVTVSLGLAFYLYLSRSKA